KVIRDNPLTGVGLNNYWLYTLQDRNHYQSPGSAVHNVYLNILAETGVVVFSIYLIFLGTIFVRFKRIVRVSDGNIRHWLFASFAAIATQLVCALFISNVYNEPFYLAVAIFLSLFNLHRQSLVEANKSVPAGKKLTAT
ncbi:MAG TPA: O-antigen ligase family protein, partial [Syntrophorhabdaceae bacterium]|nr:O-antigen ligase family protein [Syntrophorhabdaceae bacterium]